jgi:hypothetical protein
MPPKAFLIDRGDRLTKLKGVKYVSEDLMQCLLAGHPTYSGRPVALTSGASSRRELPAWN